MRARTDRPAKVSLSSIPTACLRYNPWVGLLRVTADKFFYYDRLMRKLDIRVNLHYISILSVCHKSGHHVNFP